MAKDEVMELFSEISSSLQNLKDIQTKLAPFSLMKDINMAYQTIDVLLKSLKLMDIRYTCKMPISKEKTGVQTKTMSKTQVDISAPFQDKYMDDWTEHHYDRCNSVQPRVAKSDMFNTYSRNLGRSLALPHQRFRKSPESPAKSQKVQITNNYERSKSMAPTSWRSRKSQNRDLSKCRRMSPVRTPNYSSRSPSFHKELRSKSISRKRSSSRRGHRSRSRNRKASRSKYKNSRRSSSSSSDEQPRYSKRSQKDLVECDLRFRLSKTSRKYSPPKYGSARYNARTELLPMAPLSLSESSSREMEESRNPSSPRLQVSNQSNVYESQAWKTTVDKFISDNRMNITEKEDTHQNVSTEEASFLTSTPCLYREGFSRKMQSPIRKTRDPRIRR